MSDIVRCPECRKQAPAEAQFCPGCGSPLAALTGDPSAPVVEYMRTEPRLFGVIPPLLTLAIGIGLLALAVVSFAIGSWIIGIALVVFSAPLLLAGIAAVGRDPANPAVRAVRAAPSRVRAWAGYAGTSVGAWTGAGRELFRLRTELRGLRGQRRRLQFSLGDAAYREEKTEMAELRVHMRELDEAIEACERRVAGAKRRARKQVERRRMAARPTRQLR